MTMHKDRRWTYLLLIVFPLSLIFITVYKLQDGILGFNIVTESTQAPIDHDPAPEAELAPEHVIPDHPIYKPESPLTPPIVDNFPLAAAAHSADDLPPIPPWNSPPTPHVPEKTPLFIGFTRNWPLLQQTVVSWITAGWPSEDIYVFENTGTMKSNELGLLSLQNPFFLNHTRLHMLGVNIIVTPTLFTFAQLQNFYLWTALEKNFTTYFWGHMDVVALSFESRYDSPHTADEYSGFQSIYKLAVQAIRSAMSMSPDPNSSDPSKPWAARFFAYDRLALVNRAAFEKVGGWDPQIPFYLADCDMHDRLKFGGFEYNEEDVVIGNVIDVGNTLDDLLVLYRKKNSVEASFTPEGEKRNATQDHKFQRQWVSDVPGSDLYKRILTVVQNMTVYKNENGGGGRNTWQTQQAGGKGDPYYRDPQGFEKALQMTMQLGRDVYAEKWGHRECGLGQVGRKAEDAWRVEHDWE
jgi:hypothetical protein